MKKILSILIAGILLCFVFTACSSTNPALSEAGVKSSEKAFDLDEYKGLVTACRADMQEAFIDIGNVSNYLLNYANISGEISDDAIAAGFEWLTKNNGDTLDDVNAAYDKISAAYKDIVLLGVEGTEAEEIDGYFRQMFDSYRVIYQLATTPSGSLQAFVIEYQEAVTAYTESNDYLSMFLDEDQP